MSASVTEQPMRERPDGRRIQLGVENGKRVAEVQRNRAYYLGEQKDQDNLAAAGSPGMPLPEHEKLVAYSTQIQECVDYIAGQLASGFNVLAEDEAVSQIVQGTLANSPDLASDDDEDQTTMVMPFREALICGDVAVRVRWDADAQMPWLEFWEAEEVDFQFQQDNRYKLERVILTEVVWREDALGEMVEVQRERVWEIDQETGLCMIHTLIDGDEDPDALEALPYRFIPWRMWRGLRKKMRRSRGESLVGNRIRSLADRYDATGQLSFVICRYNSHGNLAVIGDAALMQANADARISKDVADVLTFPGGTALESITLATDATMIEHQTTLTTDAIYSAFGVTRLDTSTMEGMGNLSGYALEILNRKTGSTFDLIRRQLARDIRSTLNVAVDMYAVQVSDSADPEQSADPVQSLMERAQTEYDAIYPNRAMKIITGTGYIVDSVMQRDDFTAGLVSRRWVLEQRGMDPKDIDLIEEQIGRERQASSPVTLSPAATAAAAGSDGVQAGDALSSLEPGAVEAV